MKFDINKLMKYPSQASEELGIINLADDQGINTCIQVMMINEEANFEELPLDEPILEPKTLPFTLKYAFFGTEQAKSVIISSSSIKRKRTNYLKYCDGTNKQSVGPWQIFGDWTLHYVLITSS